LTNPAARSEIRLRDIVVDGGRVDLKRFSSVLHVTTHELAGAAGISAEAAKRTERAVTPTSQRGLREMMEIIDRVIPWAGSPLQAFAWYRSEALPAFGQMTPEQVVKAGHSQALREYLDGLAVGGYA
jgi:hypothetical protein